MRWKPHSSNQRGQTIIEYVLLLVVILTIAYGLGRNFYTPLQKYGAGIFTNTIACALEYGQLPASIESEEGCSADVKIGATFSGEGSGSTGSRRGGSRTGKGGSGRSDRPGEEAEQSSNSPDANKEKNPTDTASDKAPDSGPQSEGRGGGVSAINNSKGTLQLKNSLGAESSTGGNREVVYSMDDNQSFQLDSAFGGSRGRRRRPVYRPLNGGSTNDLEDLKKKEIISERKKLKAGADGLGAEEAKAKRFPVQNRKLAPKSEGAGDNWDMARILRMALIVLVILAILLFVFMQVSQIRKGTESV